MKGLRRLDTAIEPYKRFVHTEKENLEKISGNLKGLSDKLEELKTQLEEAFETQTSAKK